MLPRVTMECRAVDEPELRFTPTGAAVAKIRTVSSDRFFDKEANEWKDGKQCWIDVTVWKQAAEHVAESVKKGDLLVVTGRLVTEEWTDKDTQQKRSKHTITAEQVALSLQFRAITHGGGQAQRGAVAPDDDPWASPASQEDPNNPPF